MEHQYGNHEHHGHHTSSTDGGHGGHDKHAGHSPQMFKRRFFVSLLLTLPILYLEPHFQEWFNYQAIQFPGSAWVSPILSTVLYFYGGWVFIEGAWRELHSRIGMMTLIALAITVAFVYSLAVTLGLQGMPFYWELATLIDVMLLGHWIEMASVQGASQALEHLAQLVPSVAHRLVGDRLEDVSVNELQAGELILIRPGEQIPIDGVVVEGASSVNEAFLTGESRPVAKQTGDEVVAGAVNGEGALKVQVTRTGEQTTLSQIMRLVQEAQNSRSRYQVLADLYGLRTWVEYGFRQCKQELGWTDYRFTNFQHIERWWEIIFCVYTMISLNSPAFLGLNQFRQIETEVQKDSWVDFSNHQQWNHECGWKNTINNWRLIIQPLLLFWLIYPWLDVFPNSHLLLGFNHLIAAMNQFKPCYASD